jgi:hypothetical protein
MSYKNYTIFDNDDDRGGISSIHLFMFSQVEGEKLPAHRVVLSACSPYFCAMFTNDMKESVEVCTLIIKFT